MTVLAGAGLVVGGSAIAKLMALAGPTRRPAPYSPQDRRESVIVLPFENSAGDPAQDSVAAGLTRDVTNLLALDDTAPVVPAATAAAFRGKPLDLRAIAREHNVHFAILGDARRQDGRLIATATLFDIIEVPRPIWSATFNRPDTPAGWNGIVAFIGNHFEHAAIPAEVARAQREHPADLDQRDLLFAAAALAAYTKANYAAQLALLERALAIDPNYLNGIVMYADTRVAMVLDEFSADRESDLAIAEKFTDRAFQLSPNNYAALRVRGKILRARGDFEGVSAVLRNLLERHPFDAMRRRELGKVQLVQGRPKEALQSFTTAKEQGLFEPAIPLVESNIAEALLADSRFTEAVAHARMAIQEFPADSGADGEEPWLVLIAAEEVSGQDLQARADLQRYLAAKPAMATIATIAKIRYLAAQVLLIDGLRRAGIPER
jgi:TolB-like protein/tetratricopeptide (TPR) repeat protein